MKDTHRMPGLTPEDLAALGLQDMAFVKRGIVDHQRVWTIHAADGTQIGSAPDRELAFAAVRQHEMEPLSVH